ncbi:MAG: HepT-like ribonuclease domain-containing protein [Candidatus Rokuibacteriota bacterium]
MRHIERYASRDRAAFEADELIQSWVVRHLTIIGEAARAIPESTRELAPGIPWMRIIGMRHILVHDYFGVDAEVVWGVVERDLGPLKREISALLARLND